MDTVMLDVVRADVPDSFYGECLAPDFDLVTLHCFLDGGADIADPYVDPGGL